LNINLSIFLFLRQPPLIHAFPITIIPLSRNVDSHPSRRGDGQYIGVLSVVRREIDT
jgi:hypothetical protein